ncbi:unnamed protein product [Closterium sp. NIES-64]|nr:unnamed protein product [Closterium sp. NIES-64]
MSAIFANAQACVAVAQGAREQLSSQPAGLPGARRVGLNAALVPSLTPVSPLKRAARRSSGTTRCSAAPQAPSAAKEVAEEGSGSKGFGVFRLTYDLKEEEHERRNWNKTIRVAVSGAAGMISNHFLFKLASGEVFGPNQPVAINMLGSERSKEALEGVAMELEDSLFPLLREVSISIDARTAFADVDWALLIGAKPRGPGMERADLLDINGQIFAEQGRALNDVANPNVKVIVVGNPCNTNALICLKNAPKLNPRNFHALTKLDENRAKCQLALKAGVFYDKISNMTIWGNHSTTMVPDFVNARILGFPATDVIGDRKWLEEQFTPQVQTVRGGLVNCPGTSSPFLLSRMSEEVLSRMSEEVLSRMSEEVLSRMSEEVLSRMSEEVLSRMSEEVLSRMSEEVLSRVSEEVLSRVSEEVLSRLAPTSLSRVHSPPPSLPFCVQHSTWWRVDQEVGSAGSRVDATRALTLPLYPFNSSPTLWLQRGGALIKKWGRLSAASTAVSLRGGALIKKWGRSSAASTAVSLVDAIRALTTPTPEGDWFSTGVYTKGNTYGIDDDLIFSLPCRSKGGTSWKQRWRPRQLQCRRPVVRLFPFCTSLHSNFPPPFSPYHAFLPTFPCTPFPVCGWQGDGDYEVVSGLIVDDYLRARINKVVVVRESEVVVVRESEVVVVRESEVVVVRESEVVVVRESEVVVVERVRWWWVRESEVVVVRESEVVVVRESEVVVVRESEVVVVRESEVVVVRESVVVVVRESEVVVVRESEVVVVRESEVVVVRESEVVVVRESEVVVVRESEVVVVRESEVVVVRESEVVVVRESEVVVVRESEVVVVRESEVVVVRESEVVVVRESEVVVVRESEVVVVRESEVVVVRESEVVVVRESEVVVVRESEVVVVRESEVVVVRESEVVVVRESEVVVVRESEVVVVRESEVVVVRESEVVVVRESEVVVVRESEVVVVRESEVVVVRESEVVVVRESVVVVVRESEVVVVRESEVVVVRESEVVVVRESEVVVVRESEVVVVRESEVVVVRESEVVVVRESEVVVVRESEVVVVRESEVVVVRESEVVVVRESEVVVVRESEVVVVRESEVVVVRESEVVVVRESEVVVVRESEVVVVRESEVVVVRESEVVVVRESEVVWLERTEDELLAEKKCVSHLIGLVSPAPPCTAALPHFSPHRTHAAASNCQPANQPAVSVCVDLSRSWSLQLARPFPAYAVAPCSQVVEIHAHMHAHIPYACIDVCMH